MPDRAGTRVSGDADLAALAGMLAELPVPRRVAVAALLVEAARGERELADLYAAHAARASVAALRAELADLAAAKARRAARLTALVAAAGSVGDGDRALAPPPAAVLEPRGRGAVFPPAFERERALEQAYRELQALLEGPGRWPELDRLAAEAAEHRARLRQLYLRYS